jgi:hypothetical protein
MLNHKTEEEEGAQNMQNVQKGQNEQDDATTCMMRFLDARTCEEKYNILRYAPEGLTDIMIDNMATSMDAVIPDGPLDERMGKLKQIVRMHAKYEIRR